MLKIARRPDPTTAKLAETTIRRLANQVETEEHWTQILAKAETDDQRQELERVVGPYLRFRRAAPCTTPSCESGQQGNWQPVLVCAAPQDPLDVTWVPIELRLCDQCKGEASLQDFLTPGIWRQVLQAWPSDHWPPVKRLTILQWDQVH